MVSSASNVSGSDWAKSGSSWASSWSSDLSSLVSLERILVVSADMTRRYKAVVDSEASLTDTTYVEVRIHVT